MPYLPKVLPIIPLVPGTVTGRSQKTSTAGTGGSSTASSTPPVLFPGLVLRLQTDRKDISALLGKIYRRSDTYEPGNIMLGCVPIKAEMLPLAIRDKEHSNDSSKESESKLGTESKNSTRQKEYTIDDLNSYGCVARLIRLERLVGGGYLAVVEGLSRFRIERFTQAVPYIEADVTHFREEPIQPNDLASHTLFAQLKQLSKELVVMLRDLKLPGLVLRRLELFIQRADSQDAGALADMMVSTVESTFAERLQLLQAVEIKQRLQKAVDLLNRQLNVLKISNKISTTVDSKLSKKQREFYLKQQLDAIKEELGESTGEKEEEDEVAELSKKINDAKMTPEAEKIAHRELKRLKKMHPQQAEYQVIRTYLENLTEIPWTRQSGVDIANSDAGLVTRARKQLDSDHYGLDKVKKRLIEYLAVLRLKQQTSKIVVRDKGPILLLVGPPGVGKTSLAKSVATALGRKFHRISLGGVRDEAEIRGHRRTYVGAMPGLIVQGLKKVGVVNPVFLLDEIDKVSGNNFHGDPAAAMLEVLDPEQNHAFNDHYVNIPIDLSKVLFIATANTLETISPPLLDRMETIELPGYTFLEKKHIAMQYLIPKQLMANGLTSDQIVLGDEAILKIATAYTREAGVRNLEREIASICRAKAVEYSELRDTGETGRYQPVVSINDIERILGIEKFQEEITDRKSRPGIVTGLAYMGSGGGAIMFIEASEMPGSGRLQLTGKLGDVIKESAQIALSWVKSNAYKLHLTTSPSEDIMKSRDVHIHCPAGAIPKDGPSAGIAMCLSLVSLFSGRQVPSKTAMTGEVTLRGRVLPIGGVKEKVLAAHRAGVTRVILPARNRKEVTADLPENVRNDINFVFVNSMTEVLQAVWPNMAIDIGLSLESHI